MRSVQLLRLQLENFRSFKHLDIPLAKGAGLHLLTGRNDESPRLGANGAGKSSLWDGVLFALWGRSARGLRGGDLVRQGAEGLVATVELAVAGQRYTLRRSAPPERILLNGERVEQLQVDALLGRSAVAFQQSVIFGQGRPLFLDLSIPERSALLDEVLNLDVWLQYSSVAGEEAARLGRRERELEYDVARLEGQLGATQHSLAQAEELSAAWDRDHHNEIERLLQRGEALEADLAVAEQNQAAADEPQASVEQAAELGKQIDKLSSTIRELDFRSADLARDEQEARKRLSFYRTATICPECKAPISDQHRNEHITAASNQIATAEDNYHAAEQATAELVSKRDRLIKKQSEMVTAIAKARDAAREAKFVYLSIKNQLEVVTSQLERLTQQTVNPNLTLIANLQSKAVDIEAQLNDVQETLLHVQGDRAAAEFWKAGFKRLRTFLAGQVLSILELDVANAASSLGLSGWRIGFSNQKETKSDTVKLGVHVTITTPNGRVSPYEAWSGGEAQRIRLASALGMAAMIERLTATVFDFEVFDEPTSWLSQEGVEDLLSCLDTRAAATGKGIWVLDHRSLQSSSFASVTTVTKNAEGESSVAGD